MRESEGATTLPAGEPLANDATAAAIYMSTKAQRHEERLRQLVQRYEVAARARPKWFAARVTAMALWGQFVAWLAVAATVGGIVWMAMRCWQARQIKDADSAKLWLSLAVLAVILLGFMIHALWIRMPAAQGLPIGRYDAPRLSEMIDDIRRQTGGPPIHEILLTFDAAAQVVCRPLWGLAGPHRSSLILGMPLMAGLSEGQMRGVLAHEFSHIHESRIPLTTWIFRSLSIWGNDNSRFFASALFPFDWWYAPRMAALAIVWRRIAERKADIASREAVGSRDAGDALIRALVIGQYIGNEYWPEVMRGAMQSVSPPGRLISSLLEQIKAGSAETKGQTHLLRALRDQTGHDDSHPSLADRLATVGWRPAGEALDAISVLPPPQQPVIDVLFEPAFADQALAILDHVAANMVAGEWYGVQAEANRSRQELKRLAEVCRLALDTLARDEQGSPLPPPELTLNVAHRLRLAKLVANVHGDRAARVWYERVLEVDRENAFANFVVGRLKLLDDDAGGCRHVEIAIERDPLLIIDGCELLYAHYRGQGELETADRYRRRAMDHADQLRRVQAEMMAPPAKEKLSAHGLPDEQVERLRDQLRRIECVRRAYLFRRRLKAMPELPIYALVIEPTKRLFENDPQRRIATETGHLQFDQPFSVFAVSIVSGFWRMKDKGESLVFNRE